MQNLIQYFTHIPSLHRALILAIGISFFWLIESAIPLFRFDYNKKKHALLNLFFTLTTLAVNFAFALVTVLVSNWCIDHSFGVLNWIHIPVLLKILAGLMILDLIGAYLIHLIEHRIKFLWKFHMVHHADLFVDTTTANRHHPGESVFRAVFTILAVFISGAPVWLIMIYQSLSVLLSQFNHANISLPRWMDQSMRWFIVSPDMHKVHHHFVRPETDSNYGNIFPFWDRIFGTYCKALSKEVKYGLDVLQNRDLESIGAQLKIPFDKTIPTDY